jgi:hypothetical protein
MKRPAFVRDIDRFLFKPQSTLALGLFRIGFGATILYCLLLLAPDAFAFFTDRGVLSVATALGNIHDRSFFFASYLTTPSRVIVGYTLLVFTAFLFTIGYHTRLSAMALYMLIASFYQRNPYVLYGVDDVVKCMLFFFVFAPSSQEFSWDRRHSRGEESTTSWPWAQRMMQFQLCFIYLSNAVFKLHGSPWFNGTALGGILGLADFNNPWVDVVRRFPTLCHLLTHTVWLTELSFPFLVWFRATRNYVMIAGALMHVGISIAMRIPCFGPAMLAPYVLFFSEQEISRLVRLVRSKLNNGLA